jgi:hypothetical protein
MVQARKLASHGENEGWFRQSKVTLVVQKAALLQGFPAISSVRHPLVTSPPPPHAVCDSPDQGGLYRILSTKFGASSLSRHLAGITVTYFSLISSLCSKWMFTGKPMFVAPSASFVSERSQQIAIKFGTEMSTLICIQENLWPSFVSSHSFKQKYFLQHSVLKP